jgi:uncharacterized protein YegL
MANEIVDLENIDLIENQDPRCPVVLLLDTSRSMYQESRIQRLNEGVRTFKQDVESDSTAKRRVEVAIVTFGGSVRLAQDFVTCDAFEPQDFKCDGDTPMGEGIRFALERLEERKRQYKEAGVTYYRPWVFLLTDGGPTDDWQSTVEVVRSAESSKRLSFFAVGVGEHPDMETLAKIAPPERPPLRLDAAKFKDLFLWLSSSMKRVSTAKPGAQTALAPATWATVST